jgi:MFS family permease
VPRELLPRSIAFTSLGWHIGGIAGPAVGGLLVAVSPAFAYGVGLGIYALTSLTLLTIRTPTKPTHSGASPMTLVKEGLVYVWREKIVFGAISLDLFAVLLGGATALMPAFAKDVLNVGAEGFGILRAAPAIGATCVGLYLATHPTRSKAGLIMLSGVAIFGVATIVFGLSTSFWLSVAALATLGGADMLSVFVRQTLIQVVTPDHMRGRVSAVATVFVGASNELGEFESGVVARLLGPVGAAIFGGVGALIVTGLWAYMFPSLRKADKLV